VKISNASDANMPRISAAYVYLRCVPCVAPQALTVAAAQSQVVPGVARLYGEARDGARHRVAKAAAAAIAAPRVQHDNA
jgi:hypothetical protein